MKGASLKFAIIPAGKLYRTRLRRHPAETSTRTGKAQSRLQPRESKVIEGEGLVLGGTGTASEHRRKRGSPAHVPDDMRIPHRNGSRAAFRDSRIVGDDQDRGLYVLMETANEFQNLCSGVAVEVTSGLIG